MKNVCSWKCVRLTNVRSWKRVLVEVSVHESIRSVPDHESPCSSKCVHKSVHLWTCVLMEVYVHEDYQRFSMKMNVHNNTCLWGKFSWTWVFMGVCVHGAVCSRVVFFSMTEWIQSDETWEQSSLWFPPLSRRRSAPLCLASPCVTLLRVALEYCIWFDFTM